MPKQQELIHVIAKPGDEILATIIEVVKKLNWETLYAGENGLTAHSLTKNGSRDRLITAIYKDGQLDVSSETTKGESIDLPGKNKKNLAAFKAAYLETEQGISAESIGANLEELTKIRLATAEQVEKERVEAEEIEAAMKLGSGNMYFTYFLIAVNVLIFILMAMQGAGIMELNGLVHIKWGSNYAPLTLGGDWWRLFTCIFLHFGIIHLLMNMYALYSIGVYLEPMLGKLKFIAAYLCTGVLASLASLWWHTEPVNSAGASGAIFGMYGLFLAMLTTDLIPHSLRKTLLSNIAIFVGYNLIYGMKGTIDNSAHIGGLLSGIVIGYLYVFAIKQERKDKNVKWIVPVIVLLTIGGTALYISQHKSDGNEKAAIERELENVGYYETDKFSEEYNQFINYQDEALAPLRGEIKYDVSLSNNLDRISLPAWDKALAVADKLQTKNLSPWQKKRVDIMEKYIHQRIDQVNKIKQLIENNANERVASLDSINNEINKTVTLLEEK